MADRIHPTLLPHLLAKIKDQIIIPENAYGIHQRINEALSRGLRVLRTDEVDVGYLLGLLPSTGNPPEEIKDKLVDCLLTQKPDELQLEMYRGMLPDYMHAPLKHYLDRKTKIEMSPAKREELRKAYAQWHLGNDRVKIATKRIESLLGSFERKQAPSVSDYMGLLKLDVEIMTEVQRSQWISFLRQGVLEPYGHEILRIATRKAPDLAGYLVQD